VIQKKENEKLEVLENQDKKLEMMNLLDNQNHLELVVLKKNTVN
jgi:hypothetical protein